jgi:DNA-directed RNA polymerase beta' subunit
MVNQQYQRQITSLYEEVQQQNEEIQAQNQALAGTQEELSTINNQLEALVQQRTQKIEEQNQQLQEYAFWNAHKLRAPVATILGLYYLLTLKEYQTEEAIEEIYIKIEKSVKDLDEVVQEIQKKIENRDTRFR